MRTSILLIFFINSINSFSQTWFPTTAPRVDTNFYFHIELRPQDDLYEYYYNTNSDTLEFVIWHDKKRTSVKTRIDTEYEAFLINNVIYSIDSLKIDKLHKPIRQYFSFFATISHNHSHKQIEIRDKFYLDKIFKMLLEFNSRLPNNAHFPVNFNFTEYDSDYLGKDTVVGADINHFLNKENKKNKFINCKVNRGLVDLTYYDTIENKVKYKQAIKFKGESLIAFQSKTINYINLFNLRGVKFTKTVDTPELFGVAYTVPGFL